MRPEPPKEIVERVRSLCAPLPGAAEHVAWTGVSWRVGHVTFAHVLQIDRGWPPAYAAAFDIDGPATVVTFQAEPDEYRALDAAGPPFCCPPWRPFVVGLVIGPDTDWVELGELIETSHRVCGG